MFDAFSAFFERLPSSFTSFLSPETRLKFTAIEPYYIGPYCVSVACLIISLLLIFLYLLLRCCRQPDFDKVHTAGFDHYQNGPEHHLALDPGARNFEWSPLDTTAVSGQEPNSKEARRRLLENSKQNLHYSASYLSHQNSNLKIDLTADHLATPIAAGPLDPHTGVQQRRSLAAPGTASFHGSGLPTTRQRPHSMAQSDMGAGTNRRNHCEFLEFRPDQEASVKRRVESIMKSQEFSKEVL